MNSPAPVLARTERMVLRVFGGRLDGAHFNLPPDRRLTLGHALDNDIVLRGSATRGCRIELSAQGCHLRISLVAGEARLLGTPLEVGQPVLLPAFVPLAVGEYSVAVGEEESPRWPEAEELALVLARGPTEAPEPPPVSRTEQARAQAQLLAHFLPDWMTRPTTLILAALGLALILALAPVGHYLTAGLRTPEQAQAALVAEGFRGVRAQRDPAGDFLVFSGAVDDDESLARLRALVAAEFPGARLHVDTNRSLARAATDILAAEGIDAEAQPGRLGTVVIESEYLPADRLQELKAKLKADLPALRDVSFDLTGARGPGDLAYFFNSERYGLATYMDGDPGYLVTADGSRWFEGAMLPTGHEVVSIRNGVIALRRNGLVEQVIVDPGIAGSLAAGAGIDEGTLKPPETAATARVGKTPTSERGDRT